MSMIPPPLNENSVVKDYLTTAADGKNYTVTYYALPMVLAVGFRAFVSTFQKAAAAA